MIAPIFIVSLLVSVSCGSEPAATATKGNPASLPIVRPDAAAAAALIRNSLEYSDFEFTSAGWALPLEKRFLNPEALLAARSLEKDGWVRLTPSGDVELTEKALQDRRFLVRPNGFVDIVPLARKEFGSVESVTGGADDQTAQAAFDWRWVPNEIGTAFKSGMLNQRFAGKQKAMAILRHDGQAWQISLIESR